MHIRLMKPDRKEVVHEGVIPFKAGDAPAVVTWGQRAFTLIDAQHDLGVYVEASTYRIVGAFGG